jgi:hypothetical protein
MQPYNNETTKANTTTNATASATPADKDSIDLLGKSRKSKLSLAEMDKPDEKKKVEKDEKEFDDEHKNKDKRVKKDSNETLSSDPVFDEIFQNMTFAVNKTLNKGWPIRRDDGFPYQEQNGQYWAGYYTTRPNLKKKIREFS